MYGQNIPGVLLSNNNSDGHGDGIVGVVVVGMVVVVMMTVVVMLVIVV